MNADYVENIIRNIDKQSYKCILVDGAWGIGKSYMVRKSAGGYEGQNVLYLTFWNG